jgi:hypothetical protein
VRKLVLVGCAALVALAAGCTSSPSPPVPQQSPIRVSPPVLSAVAVIPVGTWWQSPIKGPTTCGIVAEVSVYGRITRLGDCATLLVLPAPHFKIGVGATIDIHIATESPRPAAAPIFALPVPSNHDVKLVARSPGGATGEYRAVGPGTVTLASARARCISRSGKEIRGCPLVHLQITG